MGIGWLWFFTPAGQEDVLQARNAERAAAVYSRWRTLCHLGAKLIDRGTARWRRARLASITRRALDELSADGLSDVGLRRDGTGGFVALEELSSERPAPAGSTKTPQPASMPSASVGTRQIVGHAGLGGPVWDSACHQKDRAA